MEHNKWLSLVLAMFCVAASASALARQANNPPQSANSSALQQDTVRQILELERESKEASVHRDPEFSQRNLADDYLAITPLGLVVTKSDTVAARRSGQLRYDSIDISDLVVRVYGNTAVVTGRADVKGKDLGEEFNGPYRFTRVWVRRGGRWQAVSYQATVTR
jgi:hypothetical protein